MQDSGKEAFEEGACFVVAYGLVQGLTQDLLPRRQVKRKASG